MNPSIKRFAARGLGLLLVLMMLLSLQIPYVVSAQEISSEQQTTEPETKTNNEETTTQPEEETEQPLEEVPAANEAAVETSQAPAVVQGNIATLNTLDYSILQFVIEYAEAELNDPNFNNVIPNVQQMFFAALDNAKTVLAGAMETPTTVQQNQIDDAAMKVLDAMTYLSFIKGDKTALITLTNECLALDSANYTPESRMALEQAVQNALQVIESENALQTDVDWAYDRLLNARNELVHVVRVDKTLLQQLYDEGLQLTESEYTAESWAPFAQSMETAYHVLEDLYATQSEVDYAYEQLDEAMKGLVRVTGKTDPTPPAPVVPTEETPSPGTPSAPRAPAAAPAAPARVATVPTGRVIPSVEAPVEALPQPVAQPQVAQQQQTSPQADALEDNQTPLGGQNEDAGWAIANLALGILTILLAVFTIASGWRKSSDEVSKKRIAGMVALATGIASTAVFALTQNLVGPMVAADSWTPLMALLAVVPMVAAILVQRLRSKAKQAI